MSLRRRLLAGILALLVVAIGVTDAVTYTSLRSFLIGRLDEQTASAEHQVWVAVDTAYHRALAHGSASAATHPTAWLAALVSRVTPATTVCSSIPAAGAGGVAAAPPARFDPFDRVSPDVFVEVLAPDRRLLLARASGSCDPRPVVPEVLHVQRAPAARDFGASGGPYFPDQQSFTTGSVGTTTAYRAEAVQIPGGILVTAVPLTPDSQTLASMVRVEVVTSVGVLLAAVLLALLVARLGLRPLDEMTETAGAIADGDLSRRIRTTDTRSEVGRLGHALNGMLAQIEAAFAERTRSEGRLRRFLADASHELRTPLTSVRGYAELLRKGVLADAGGRAQAAGRIEREAARMGLLVDDLLLLARTDRRRPLEREPVDLARVAADAADDARVAGHHHPVTVVAPGPVPVTGDKVRLRQVVDNLLANALQHTPPGTTVTVSAVVEDGDGVLRVADRGPGLSRAQAAQVFEPFYRAGTARPSAQEDGAGVAGAGVGLGLAIVAALAEAHGGSVRVWSEPGEGACFEVRLPTAERGDPGGAAGGAAP